MRQVWNAVTGYVLGKLGRVAYVDYVPTYRAALTNAVADACLTSVRECGVPRRLAAWNRRQIGIASAITDATGIPFYDVLPEVARVFPKVCPRVYDVPRHALLSAYDARRHTSTAADRTRRAKHGARVALMA